MTIKTILITGSNGFIGSGLVSHFNSNPNYHVIGISKGINRVSELNDSQYIDTDITQNKQVREVFSRIKPDVVIHCAAISQVDICESNPKLCNDVNVEATELIALECEKLNTRLIFLSSDFVFDGTLQFIHDETVPNPISVYGKSKRESELNIELNLKDWAIVRPVLVYGFSSASSRTNIFSWVYNSLKEEKTIKVVSDHIRTPTFIDDVVLLIDQLVKSNGTGYFNIGGSTVISVFRFAQKVAELSALNSSFVIEGNSNDIKGAHLRPVNTCFKNERIYAEFSMKPLNFSEGIKKALLQING